LPQLHWSSGWLVSHSSLRKEKKISEPHYRSSSSSSSSTIWVLEEVFNISQSSSCTCLSIQVTGISSLWFPALLTSGNLVSVAHFLHMNVMCFCLYNLSICVYPLICVTKVDPRTELSEKQKKNHPSAKWQGFWLNSLY
jgi:hypothetical protein